MNFPVYFQFNSLKIHPHFLFEALSYIVAFNLILPQMGQDTILPHQRRSIISGGLVGAVIGAKLLVLAQHLDLLWSDWHLFILLFLQGKTIVGGLIGGLIGVEVTKKIIAVKRSTGDIFVYPLVVGIAIGRIGCFLTGLSDMTYGISTNLPWGVDFGDGIYRHPTQLYEIIFLMFLLIFLQFFSRYQEQEGDLFKFFMISYLGFRFFIDFLKPDFDIIFSLSAIQISCLCALIYYRKALPYFFRFTFSS